MRTIKTSSMVVALGMLLSFSAAGADSLTWEKYQASVKSQNTSLAAAQASVQALQRRLAERDLLTSPYLFGEGQIAGDKSESLERAVYGDERYQDQVRLGLEQRTGFGLTWRALHQTVATSIEGNNPLYMPWAEFYTSKTGVELSQDLWRNFGGREVLAAADAMDAQTRAELAQREYEVRQVLSAAQNVYWQLVLSREYVRVQQDLLERAQRLAAWVGERVRMKLQDASDLMQAESQVQMRKLSLAQAMDQERQAARGFNLLRGIDSDQVEDTLDLPTDATLAVPALPETAPPRPDVVAMEWMHQAATRQAVQQQEGLQPEAKVTAGAYLNGLDEEFSGAWSEATSQTDYVSYAVGLNIRIPLDYFSRRPIQNGYADQAQAARKAWEQKKMDAESEWRELCRRMQEHQERLQIVRDLEALQKKKADYERRRLQRGNSITFQVLQFEQDWSESQLARIQIEGAILELMAKIKVYGE